MTDPSWITWPTGKRHWPPVTEMIPMPEKNSRLPAHHRLGAVPKDDPNQYDCASCLDAGKEHAVVKDIHHGHTTRDSNWGAGIPTTIHRCAGCGRWNGPWVSADIVGGGW